MLKVLARTAHYIDLLNDITGRLIAWLTLAMVLVTCAVVAARYAFDFGSIGLQESVMYMHGIVFMLSIGYTLKEKGHVRVDVLYEKFSKRTRDLIDLAGHIVFLIPVSVFIFWISLEYVSFSWSVLESSGQPGGLPGVYLLKTLLPMMAALLFVQGISEAFKIIVRLAESR